MGWSSVPGFCFLFYKHWSFGFVIQQLQHRSVRRKTLVPVYRYLEQLCGVRDFMGDGLRDGVSFGGIIGHGFLLVMELAGILALGFQHCTSLTITINPFPANQTKPDQGMISEVE